MCIIRFHARAGYLQHYEFSMKLCSRKSTSIQALRRFHLTSMKWRQLHWLTVISTCRASLVYAIPPWLPCWIGGTCVGFHRYVQNAMFYSKYKYIRLYTMSTVSYTCLFIYIHCFNLKFVSWIGRQPPVKWQCASWHQPPQTQQDRIGTGSCSPIDSARWGFSTQVVGVYLPYSTPYLALAAYKVGWVDWGEHAGGVGISR